MNQVVQYAKPIAAYAATAALSWAASRYHLSGDQVAAIASDLATVGAAALGVWMHVSKGSTNA